MVKIKEKAYYRNKPIHHYFAKLLRKGFKRENTDKTIIFSFNDNGFKRIIELNKREIEFREVKPRIDRSLQFGVF